jgi:anaphase-promoting complex subunit 2
MVYPWSTKLDHLDIGELSRVTAITAASVKRCVLFWVAHGILKEVSPDTFQVLEHAEAASPNQCLFPIHSNVAVTASAIVSASSNVQSTAEQAESEMQIYWYGWYMTNTRTFIVGMLTNLGVLPVERIQSMLSMFIPAPNAYNRTEDELRDFLTEEVKKGRLEFIKGEGGGYKLIQQ